jgi:hypothetical protein
MVEAGKEDCEKLEGENQDKYQQRKNVFINDNAKNMGKHFEPGSLDLITSSFALQYNAQGWEHKRDIEEILLATNKALKDDGYGIFILPNQATEESGFEGLKQLVGLYGFDIVVGERITAHGTNPESNRQNQITDFYLLLYTKNENATELVEGGDDIVVYLPYKKRGIGGGKVQELKKKRGIAKPKKTTIEADEFKVNPKSGEKISLSEYIHNSPLIR